MPMPALRRAAFALALLAPCAHAGEGELDRNFDRSGQVAVAFDLENSLKADTGLSTLVVNPTNPATRRYITVGVAFDAQQSPQLALAALREDGTLATDFFPGGAKLTRPTLLADLRKAILVKNRILVLGRHLSGGNEDFGVQAFKLDGTVDPSFGTLSLTTIKFDLGGTNVDIPFDILADANDDVYVVGVVQRTGADTDFGIAKLNGDGGLVAGFGSASAPGRTVVPFDVAGSLRDGARAASLFGDVLYVAGNVEADASGRQEIGVAAIDRATGNLDGTLCAQIAPCSDSLVAAPGKRLLGVMADGKQTSVGDVVADIGGFTVYGQVAAPTAADPLGTDGIAQRVLASGSIDYSWGAVGGTRRIELFDRTTLTSAVLFSTTLTVVGSSYDVASNTEYGIAYRFNVNGSPDTTFARILGAPSALQFWSFPRAAQNVPISTQARELKVFDTRPFITGTRTWTGNDRDVALVRLQGFYVFKDGLE